MASVLWAVMRAGKEGPSRRTLEMRKGRYNERDPADYQPDDE